MVFSKVCPPGFYVWPWQRFVIEFDEFGRSDLIGVLPSVVALRIARPFDQILQGLGPPPGPMGTDLFYFIFFFPINQIQRRSGKVGAV
jgi:hypothetical protein